MSTLKRVYIHTNLQQKQSAHIFQLMRALCFLHPMEDDPTIMLTSFAGFFADHSIRCPMLPAAPSIFRTLNPRTNCARPNVCSIQETGLALLQAAGFLALSCFKWTEMVYLYNSTVASQQKAGFMQYILLFLEGMITFISPCLLPMLPIYISYFAGQNDEEKGRAFTNSLGFVLGFTLIFVLLGAFSGVMGRFLVQYSLALNIVTGAIVIAFGLGFMGVFNLKFLQIKGVHVDMSNPRFFSSMLFGVVFSIGWTPCVGAFLGSALMLAAAQGSAAQGILMLLCYSLGLGIPLVASAILIQKLKGTFDFIKKHYKIINLVSGSFLIIMGVLMMTGLMGKFLNLLTIS